MKRQSIELVEPDPGSLPTVIAGSAVTVRARAGNALVKHVGFNLDDVLIGTDTTAGPGNVFRMSLLTPTGRQHSAIGVEGIDVFGVHTERQTVLLPLRANALPVANALFRFAHELESLSDGDMFDFERYPRWERRSKSTVFRGLNSSRPDPTPVDSPRDGVSSESEFS